VVGYSVKKILSLRQKQMSHSIILCGSHFLRIKITTTIFIISHIYLTPKSLLTNVRKVVPGHTQYHCHHLFRYVKCSENHNFEDCPKYCNSLAKSALCDTDHTVNFKGCSICKLIFKCQNNNYFNLHKNTLILKKNLSWLLIRLFFPSPPWRRLFLTSGFKPNPLPKILTSN